MPVVLIDEAHLLGNTDLESLRMLMNTGMDTGSHFALLLVGQPTLCRRLKLAVLEALDQRISTTFAITGWTWPKPRTTSSTTSNSPAHPAPS